MLQTYFDKKGNTGKITASFHPGYVATNIFKALDFKGGWTKLASRFMVASALTPRQGAQAALWLSLAEGDMKAGGFYERNKLITLPWYNSITPEKSERLWARWNIDAGLQQSDWQF